MKNMCERQVITITAKIICFPKMVSLRKRYRFTVEDKLIQKVDCSNDDVIFYAFFNRLIRAIRYSIIGILRISYENQNPFLTPA